MGFRPPSIGRGLPSRCPFPGELRHEIPGDMSHTDSGRRRPKVGADRLHGLERLRECPRSKTHLPAARQGTTTRRGSKPAKKGRKARFRLMGGVRAKLRGPPYSVRASEFNSVLGEG